MCTEVYAEPFQRSNMELNCKIHCVETFRIQSFPGPYFPTFGLNTESYGVSLRIQSECGKMWTRKTPNTDTFHMVIICSILDLWKDCEYAYDLFPCWVTSKYHPIKIWQIFYYFRCIRKEGDKEASKIWYHKIPTTIKTKNSSSTNL